MSQEDRIFQGVLFAPGAQELRALKLKAHCLDMDYNRTYEYETEKRAEILKKLVTNRYLNLNKKTQVITPCQQGEMVYEVVKCSIPSLLNPERFCLRDGLAQ